jgi:MFS family permease
MNGVGFGRQSLFAYWRSHSTPGFLPQCLRRRRSAWRADQRERAVKSPHDALLKCAVTCRLDGGAEEGGLAAIEASEGRSASSGLTAGQVAAAVIGNALEFFDFTTYAFFAVQIGKTFFPGHTPFDTLILSLITFGVGFIGRPVGAVVIGRYGDRAGRRPAMMLSFCLMCVGVLGLAVTPSYAQIGPAAPVLVLAARLVQGFALGGEVGPTTAFLIEAAPASRRGFFGSWQYASQCLANLTAGLIGIALVGAMSAANLDSWGWRAPFLMGAAAMPLGWIIRRGLPETLTGADRQIALGADDRRDYRRAMLLALPMLCSTTISFAMFNFLTTWAEAILHMPRGAAFGATVAWGATGFVFSLAGGRLSDRWGRKALMLWPRIAFLAAIMPCFLWIATARSSFALIAGTIVLSSLASLSNAVSLVCLTEAIPKNIRSGSLALIYAVAIAIFNGTAQLLVARLVQRTGDPLWPAYYLLAATAIGVAAMAAMRETAPGRIVSADRN